jgi:hypothetical protein
MKTTSQTAAKPAQAWGQGHKSSRHQEEAPESGAERRGLDSAANASSKICARHSDGIERIGWHWSFSSNRSGFIVFSSPRGWLSRFGMNRSFDFVVKRTQTLAHFV